MAEPQGDLGDLGRELARSRASFIRIAVAISEVFEEMCGMIRAVFKSAWESYVEAGAPYGRTFDGFQRWVEETLPDSDLGDRDRLRRVMTTELHGWFQKLEEEIGG